MMKFLKLDRQSIVFRLIVLIISMIIGQAVLLSLFLIVGGVLSQAEQNAYNSFSEKVSNRKDYLQREMTSRWTNISPYGKEISLQYNADKNPDQFLSDISTSLITMLRSTQATGVFVILNSATDEKPALYIRDYDPLLNDYTSSDLYYVYGSANLANNLKIPLDQMWKYRIDLSTMNADFYNQPASKVSLSTDPTLLGYWSLPFKLTPRDGPIITYSQPLFDKNNQFIGVIGVELSEQYLSKYLPGTDLQTKDSYGYLLGFRESHSQQLETILLTKSIQERFTHEGEPLNYSSIDADHSIFLLKNSNSQSKLYLAVENLDLYNTNTPFESNQWYLIGIMNESNLLAYVYRIRNILIISFIASVIIGVLCTYFISYRFTKPIAAVARKVKESTAVKAIKLEHIKLSEVDELLDAIQITSNMLLETSGRMSRIVEMVGLPLGVFEYRDDSEAVFFTDQIPILLSLDDTDTEIIMANKTLFIALIDKLLSTPEESEENVYYINQIPEKWLRIKHTQNDHATIGVILDMTDEMSEKKKILVDRDTDPLTGIYNRKAMQLQIEATLANRDLKKVSALLMFDLDNLKFINDTYGHKWGDTYIKHAVRHLSEIEPSRQILGRRSGDEFTLFLYNFNSQEEIRSCLKDFFQNLIDNQLEFPDGIIKPITISAGLTWINETELTYDDYLQQADELLYKAKRNHKGYYCEP
ncbi:diguanylate cyclase precursor [Acetobacterium woodii DSM 1030]|uniref:Diguanylate cyclase n=2 Tax=Acetobacterium woodii TaxID=33952 RepID=H6LK77_ACEWD|nr:diguanylate cyclase precursor [Acetobacterium woodii DSM 1030]